MSNVMSYHDAPVIVQLCTMVVIPLVPYGMYISSR